VDCVEFASLTTVRAVSVTEVVVVDCVSAGALRTVSATILRWTFPVAVFGITSTTKTCSELAKNGQQPGCCK
jgi:hypothetical protein